MCTGKGDSTVGEKRDLQTETEVKTEDVFVTHNRS